MNIILLAGGAGKRLWPLSNDICSKQFIKILKNSDGEHESMIQRIYKNIKKVDNNSVITVAVSKKQVPFIKNMIEDDIEISVEPCRKDTFPAIVLAAAYLHDVKNFSLDELVVVCPVDHFVEKDYFDALHELWELAKETNVNLSMMGIEPSYASEQYGYIIPENKNKVSRIKTDMQVMRFNGEWKDVGTWSALTDSIDEEIIGKAIKDNKCENTNIINELNIPILCMGTKDLVIVANSNGILISDKHQASNIKPFVENINEQFMSVGEINDEK